MGIHDCSFLISWLGLSGLSIDYSLNRRDILTTSCPEDKLAVSIRIRDLWIRSDFTRFMMDDDDAKNGLPDLEEVVI